MDIFITVFCLILLFLVIYILVRVFSNALKSINSEIKSDDTKQDIESKIENEKHTDNVIKYDNITDNIIDEQADNISIHNINDINTEKEKESVKEFNIKEKKYSYFNRLLSRADNIAGKLKNSIVKVFTDAKKYSSRVDKDAYNTEKIILMKKSVLLDKCDNNDSASDNSLYSHLKNKDKKYVPRTNLDLKMLANDKNINLADIDISMVEDCSSIFENSVRRDFSGIDSWNTRNVTNMEKMFANAVYFNADISSWKVNNVKNMNNMFAGAVNFNQNLNSWWVKSNISVRNIFRNTPLQNNPPEWYHKCIKYKAKYVDEKVTFGISIFLFLFYIYALFLTPEKSSIYYFYFEPETKKELVSLIKDKHIPLTVINTHKITDMSWLFYGGVAVDYKGIEKWDVSNVENMEGMFCGVGVLAKNLNNWNVSKVTNMQYMFAETIVLKEYLQWNINENVLYYGMFKNLPKEYETPEWYQPKNEFDIKYYPADKAELINLLNDKNILAGEIDVSSITDMSHLFENVSPVKIDYYTVYRSLLRGKYLEVEDVTRIDNITATGFYDKLVDIKQYIHDIYPGIEFWNVSNVDNMSYMFKNSNVVVDYQSWDISNVKSNDEMFEGSLIDKINNNSSIYFYIKSLYEE